MVANSQTLGEIVCLEIKVRLLVVLVRLFVNFCLKISSFSNESFGRSDLTTINVEVASYMWFLIQKQSVR